MAVTCPHRTAEGNCSIASNLASAACPHPPEPTCAACAACEPPQDINWITLSLALHGLRGSPEKFDALLQVHGDLIPFDDDPAAVAAAAARLQRIVSGNGVGSQLWQLLETLGIRHTSHCGCVGLAEQMNAWGAAGCLLARVEIVDRMQANAKAYGWGSVATAAIRAVVTGLAFRLSVVDPYGSLLDEAIRRAEIAEQSRCANPAAEKEGANAR